MPTPLFLITSFHSCHIAALIHDDDLKHLAVHNTARPSLVGNLYAARIDQRMGKSDNYGIDIGIGTWAFLTDTNPHPLGEMLVVKALRDGYHDGVTQKGPKVSTTLSREPATSPDLKAPGLLEVGHDPIQRLFSKCVAAYGGQQNLEVHILRTDYTKHFRGFLNADYPEYAKNITIASNGREIEELFPITEEISDLQNRTVTDPTGWSIAIDSLPAATLIDVNAGGHPIPRHQINLQASELIAQQIRLRNLGGIILVDFLKTTGKKKQQEVLAALTAAVKDDLQKTDVLGFTRGGFVELLRHRQEAPLSQNLIA